MSSTGANNGESVPKPRSPLVRPKPLTPARATPPKTASPGGPGSAGKKDASVAGGQQAGSLEEHEPVDPAVLANAMANLDTLRKVKTPSASTAPSAATSPAASGASSPNPGGLPTHGLSQTVMLQGAGQPAGGVPVTLQMAPASQPPTPAVTGQAQGQQQGVSGQQGQGQQQGMDVKISAASAPGTPHFGAQSEMLKALDNTTKVIRQSAKAPQRAPSVSGIGTVVEKPDYSEAKIVVAMVGLPARGKSYLSNRLMRYLRWLEFNVDVFNVGQLRRSKARQEAGDGGPKAAHTADYFSHSNAKAKGLREKLAEESLESLISWLKKEGNVGIMDATNSTFERREWIRKRVSKEPNLQLLFLESFCNDPKIIATNVALKARSGDPDYAGMSQEEAVNDFKRRIEAYEKVYQTITEPGISFCRILNVGEQVTINKIEGYLQSRIAFYLMNLHLKPRHIYLSRHGESVYNVEGKIGGDSDLSPQGFKYAQALPELVKKHVGDTPLEVWTSTLQRTIQTGSKLPFEKKTWKSLDELDAGVCDGMTYEEIEEKYPEDYEARDDDKFNYRYRGGESYRDVVVRLEPVIMELERQENILIIAHQAILRCLYAYFMSLSQDELPYIKIPLHTLIRITPMAYGCHEERYPLPIQAVDTHRPNPKKTGKAGLASVAEDSAANEAAAEGAGAAGPGEGGVRGNVARDYFGTHTGGVAVHADSVAKALEQAKEGGDMAPSAAVTK